jgi:hypothetical protein
MKKHFLPSIPPISCGRSSFVAVLFLLQTGLALHPAHAQVDEFPRGAHQMPYQRYESEAGARGDGAVLEQSPQFNQNDIASEASDRAYVSLPANGSYVEWTVAQTVQGVNLRFTLPDSPTGTGQSGTLGLYVNDIKVKTIQLSSYWAYQYFVQPGPGVQPNPRQTPNARTFMRFDEVHFRLADPIPGGSTIRITKDHGDALAYGVDFLELEPVPDPLAPPLNVLSVTDYGAVPNDDVDDHAAIDACIKAAAAQGKNVFIPTGQFHLSKVLELQASGIKIQGAGIWYTELYFYSDAPISGGIMADASNVEISHLSLNTANNDRLKYTTGDNFEPKDMYKKYKGFMGTYGQNSKIHDVWVEHFECGFWIGDYNPPLTLTQGLVIARARIRNNYADGVNFCRGTSGSVVEMSSIRNGGDDGLASFPEANDGLPVGRNNVFRYNTIENNWRAGGVALFGGTGHEVHHNVIRDGVGGSGIRLNTEFWDGHPFEPNGETIKIYQNTIIACGTGTDLWNNERGAIEIFTGEETWYSTTRGIHNVTFSNNHITNAQRHAVRFSGGSNAGDVIRNIVFNHTRIEGTGRDGGGGYGILAKAYHGGATFNHTRYSGVASGRHRNVFDSFILTLNDTDIPLTGIALSNGNLALAEGTTAPLTVTYSPANATNNDVTWTSSNPAAATVTATGTGTAGITARGAGTAVVTVQSAEGSFTQTCTVTVTPAVNITATDGAAGEGGNPGTFTISTAATNASLTVSYVVGGTAAPGDYAASPALTGSVTLTPAAPSRTITITPVDDNSPEGAESLTLTLQPGTGFALGGNTAATVSIADNDGAPSACAGPAIAFTATAPVIDQAIDAAWNNAPAGSLDKVVLGTMPPDFAGSRWRALYDNTNLYVLVEVKDANKRNDSNNHWWEDDGVELFIDGDNSKGGPYDGINDFQYAFRYADLQRHLGGNPPNSEAGVTFEIYEVTGGYNLEVMIPWSTLRVTPSAGKFIGFEIEVNDDDDGGNREAQLAFASTSGAHASPSLFGTVALSSCGGATTSAPVINSSLTAGGSVGSPFSYRITAANGPAGFNATGLPAGLSVDAATGVISGTPTQPGTRSVTLLASNSAGTDTKTLTLAVNEPAGVVTCYRAPGPLALDGSLDEAGWNPTGTVAKNTVGTGNNTMTFGVLWDDTYLYVGAKVLDAVLRADSPNAWEDDAIEIFLDANHNQSTTYDGLDNQIVRTYNGGSGFTKFSLSGLRFASAPVSGGYTLEVAIPWSQLGITAPANGTTLGFDLAYDDDDDGGTRDAQAVWHGTGDNFQSTAAFGKLVVSSAQPGGRLAVEAPEFASVVLLPNPVTQGTLQVVVPPASGEVQVQVLDLQGRTLLRQRTTADRVTLGVAHLNKGAYVALVQTRGKMIVKKFVIQ